MAGLGIDDGPPKTYTRKDFTQSLTIFTPGRILWPQRCFATETGGRPTQDFRAGASVLANALMTDYPLGAFRLYSFRVHGALDYGVAAASAAIPEHAADRGLGCSAVFPSAGRGREPDRRSIKLRRRLWIEAPEKIPTILGQKSSINKAPARRDSLGGSIGGKRPLRAVWLCYSGCAQAAGMLATAAFSGG